MESVIESLNRWTLIPVSLTGDINILKINTLPKLLILFQSIPLSPLKLFFTRVKDLIKYLPTSSGTIDTLGFFLLYLTYNRRCLKLASLHWYYWAAQLRAAMCYFTTCSRKNLQPGSSLRHTQLPLLF